MDKQHLEQVVSELQFLDGLSVGDQQKLAQISRLMDFSAGTQIFSEGSDTNELYLLRSGRVELCLNVAARGCVPILTLEEGDLLGWSAALGQGEMTTTAVAVKDTHAVGITADKLQVLCEQDHDIGYEIMRRVAVALSRRLVATRLQVLDVFADPQPDMPDAKAETTE